MMLGLFAIWICNGVVYRAFGGGFKGFICVVVGIFILPFTVVAAPLYAGLKWGNWTPLIATYSLGILAMVTFHVGNYLLFSGVHDQARGDIGEDIGGRTDDRKPDR
jgi:hypothetical protein